MATGDGNGRHTLWETVPDGQQCVDKASDAPEAARMET